MVTTARLEPALGNASCSRLQAPAGLPRARLPVPPLPCPAHPRCPACRRDEYEVVAVDLRGYGESSKPAGRAAYRLDRLAGDVLAVAQRLLEGNKQEQVGGWGAGGLGAAAGCTEGAAQRNWQAGRLLPPSLRWPFPVMACSP